MRLLAFPESTKSEYRSHRKAYLRFCACLGCPAIPATRASLAQYAAYLGRSRAFSTVQQYLNIVCLLHLELGVQVKDNWPLQSVLRGIKIGQGCTVSHKMPLNLTDLLQVRSLLDLSAVRDTQFWAAILCCFFGLLRISNVTVATSPGDSKCIARNDCLVTV